MKAADDKLEEEKYQNGDELDRRLMRELMAESLKTPNFQMDQDQNYNSKDK